jgi:hypothetical protein
MEEEGSSSSSERMVEVLEELLSLLRGNDGKLSKGKGAQQPQVDHGPDKPFRWYERSDPGLGFMCMSTSGEHISALI